VKGDIGIPNAERPTNVRYHVLALACSLSMVNYLDKVCMGLAKSSFAKDFGLNDAIDINPAITAFTIAYALFEVPSGWLGDVFGPRSVLIRIVLWWSFFTVLTGMVGLQVSGVVLGGLGTLIVLRFLFGMGEAGCYPNITRALHNWFPFHQRGFTQGAVWMCGRLMGGLTPLAWMILVEGIGQSLSVSGDQSSEVVLPALLGPGNWRATFYVFGIIGVAWCVWFALWFRNRPEEKASVNKAELALIRGTKTDTQAAHANIPWLKILKSPNLWLLCLMYACLSYGWYFYMTDLSWFFDQQHSVTKTGLLAAIYKGGPLWMGAIGCVVGGLLTDRFIRRTGKRRLGRSLFGILGLSLTAACFLAAYWVESLGTRPDPFWFFVAISFSGFFTDLTMGPAWATVQDVGKRYAAIVAGFMNMVGNAGGALATWVNYIIVNKAIDAHAAELGTTASALSSAEKAAGALPGYRTNFLIYAAVFMLGVVCWALIDASKPVVREEAAESV
jgi:MFS transporter, ACS family, glucarate transporter